MLLLLLCLQLPIFKVVNPFMPSSASLTSRLGESFRLTRQGLRTWGRRHILVAAVATVLVGLLIGVATVLVPNQFFARDIATVWWNYPVWILTSVLAGMVAATFVQPEGVASDQPATGLDDRQDKRSTRFGLVGTVLAWFAVGCPVCNKIALLALGYSGAITWFAPVQPFLALGSVVLLAYALVVRLKGQAACPVGPNLGVAAAG